MRRTLLALGTVGAALLAFWLHVSRPAELPSPFELPSPGPHLESVCAEAIRKTPPDHSWVSPDRAAPVTHRPPETVTLDQLPFLQGAVVRVAGVLHAESEWAALYPSRRAMEEDSFRAPWVRLSSLWPDEPCWNTRPISDRCVVVEGTYRGGAGGHFGMFQGEIADVHRLDVWSTPHRPFVTTPPPAPPSPSDPSCSEPLAAPALIAAHGEMLADFNRLYETGEFQLGVCVVELKVEADGSVDTVRVTRPAKVHERVESALIRSMQSRRYSPATACSRPLPSVLAVVVGHCPVRTGPAAR